MGLWGCGVQGVGDFRVEGFEVMVHGAEGFRVNEFWGHKAKGFEGCVTKRPSW